MPVHKPGGGRWPPACFSRISRWSSLRNLYIGRFDNFTPAFSPSLESGATMLIKSLLRSAALVSFLGIIAGSLASSAEACGCGGGWGRSCGYGGCGSGGCGYGGGGYCGGYSRCYGGGCYGGSYGGCCGGSYAGYRSYYGGSYCGYGCGAGYGGAVCAYPGYNSPYYGYGYVARSAVPSQGNAYRVAAPQNRPPATAATSVVQRAKPVRVNTASTSVNSAPRITSITPRQN